jgi:citrate synthase
MMSSVATYQSGLEGVVAAQTKLSHVDGSKGELIIGGFAVEELAPYATFEEVVFLLWNDRLPDAEELERWRCELAQWRALPYATVELLRSVAREQVPTMDALRMAAGTLDLELPAAMRSDKELGKVLVARMPSAVAAYWRLRQGLPPIAPDTALGHAANYLYMLKGERPSLAATQGLQTYLNTVSDHGLNASTFTARVIVATRSDLVSAVTGALGALKGPLHGGAPGPALDMVFEIGTEEHAEDYLRAKLERGERLMGFGHRIYKVRDPRAEVLGAAAQAFYRDAGQDQALYRLATAVEATAVRLLTLYKPDRNLQTNVEFYTALLLHGLGLPAELFTPTFAVGRVAGWVGHALEQIAAGRLIRPSSEYIGATNRRRQSSERFATVAGF